MGGRVEFGPARRSLASSRCYSLEQQSSADDDTGVRPASKCLWRASAGGLLIAFALASSGCKLHGVDAEQYTAQNIAALRDVPVFPGARLISSVSQGDRHGNGWPAEDDPPTAGPYMRFVTERSYRLPSAASPDEVLRFYDAALHGHWRLAGYDGGGRFFRKGSAGLDLSVAVGVLYLRVDHHAY
jgi:hypothetical protein